MSGDYCLMDLITYDEMYKILKEKFNVTHEELRYWIKIDVEKIYEEAKNRDMPCLCSDFLHITSDSNLLNDILVPFSSDIPYGDTYPIPHNHFFYPKYYFYSKKTVLNFTPFSNLRFVYQKNLTGIRNWNDYRGSNKESSRSLTLLKANEVGILRFYNELIDDFTFFDNHSRIWAHFDGESYVENPESFFLLYDILNVERIFFGKDKELCLNELGLKPHDLPKNVINIKNAKG